MQLATAPESAQYYRTHLVRYCLGRSGRFAKSMLDP
jgi:hypothetical protein